MELVRSSGKSIGKVAKDLDLGESALREWVRRAQEPEFDRKLVDDDERAELKRLREEVRELRMQRDFLKKATAFFAKESK